MADQNNSVFCWLCKCLQDSGGWSSLVLWTKLSSARVLFPCITEVKLWVAWFNPSCCIHCSGILWYTWYTAEDHLPFLSFLNSPKKWEMTMVRKTLSLEHRAGGTESSEFKQCIFNSCYYWHYYCYSLFSSVQKLLSSVTGNNLPHKQELVTLLTFCRS